MASNDITTESAAGRRLGPFDLEEEIGRGGMGVVYRATERDTGSVVAVKLMLTEFSANPRFRERFLREAEFAPKLAHPNIVPVYGWGEADGELYIAMRLIDGISLDALVAQEGPLELSRAIDIFGQAAAALDSAHEAGVLHRDVKPQNILVIPRRSPRHADHVYLADFGLVRPIVSDSTVSRTGQIFGSVPYMAPELIENQPADGRADVYALGCVLYECLTGSSPFERDSEVSLIWAQVHEQPPRVTAKRSDLSMGVDDVVLRSMAKHPDDRYLTCGEMVTDLRERANKNVAELAYRKFRPLIDRAPRRKTERDVWSPNFFPELARIKATKPSINWTKVAGFAATVLLLSSIQFGREGGLSQAVADATDVARSAGGSVIDAVLGDDDGAEGKDPETQALGESRTADGPSSSRSAQSQRDGREGAGPGEEIPGTFGPGVPQSGAPNAPRAEIVFTRGGNCSPCNLDREIFRTDASGVRQLTHNRLIEEAPSWSPDGSRIAFFREDEEAGVQLWVMDANGRRERLVHTVGGRMGDSATYSPDMSDSGITWSPNGKRLAFALDGRPGIFAIDLDGSDLTELFSKGGTPEWSPDGRRIMFTHVHEYDSDSAFYELWMMDADGGRPRPFLQPFGADIRHPTWSPDGTKIAYSEGQFTVDNAPGTGDVSTYHVYVIEVVDRYSARRVTTERGEMHPSFSPDGTRLVYVQHEDLFTVGVDGNGIDRMTVNDDNSAPDWQWFLD